MPARIGMATYISQYFFQALLLQQSHLLRGKLTATLPVSVLTYVRLRFASDSAFNFCNVCDMRILRLLESKIYSASR